MNRFEVVDASEERYQPLGSFASLRDAIDNVEQHTENGPGNLPGIDLIEDVITVKIIEHPIGFGPVRWVWSRTWLATYMDGADDPVWTTEEVAKQIAGSA